MPGKNSFITKPTPEKALLAGVEKRDNPNKWPLSESMFELAELARSVGAKPVITVTHKIHGSQPTYVGKGKLMEIVGHVKHNQIKIVILDDELRPSQQKVLEEKLQVKVIDRTALIIDLFAQRARSREGKLQVDLAQTEYLLPRLAGQWSHLERLGGGIGTRGPGETQIETDRRLVRSKLSKIKKEINKIQKQRRQQRNLRRVTNKASVSIVGYTNAGKSALFNQLTTGRVVEKNQLFSTLDTTTRRIQLNRHSNVTISDTVGFVSKLPSILVSAFKTTLEEASEADLFLHVVDVSNDYSFEKYEIVNQMLTQLSLAQTPSILVLNKIDLLKECKRETIERWNNVLQISNIDDQTPIAITSATKHYGLKRLKNLMENKIQQGNN